MPNEYQSGRDRVRTSGTAPSSTNQPPGVKARTPKDPYVVDNSAYGNSAYNYYADLLNGIDPALAKAARRVAQNTLDHPELFMSELRQTPAYAQRFAGNVARQKAGLPMLSESDYLQQESNYRSVLRQYGMPSGFYDDPSDFATFIGEDISPQEIGARAKLASDLVNSKDAALISELGDMGLSKGDLAAYFLDPDRAMPALQKKYDTALVGSEAERAGFSGINTGFNRKLVDAGITQDQARVAYQNAARDQPTLEKLAGMEKVNFDANGVMPRGAGVKNVVKANLGLDPKAAARVRGLVGKEKGRFRGTGAGLTGMGSADRGSY